MLHLQEHKHSQRGNTNHHQCLLQQHLLLLQSHCPKFISPKPAKTGGYQIPVLQVCRYSLLSTIGKWSRGLTGPGLVVSGAGQP